MKQQPDVVMDLTLHKEEILAIQAVHRGEATPPQQTLCLNAIMVKLCRMHDMPYAGDTHDSAFLAGRIHTGQRILHTTHIAVGKLDD